MQRRRPRRRAPRPSSLYGDALPGGGIGLDDGVTVPVVGLPSALGRRLAARARRRAGSGCVDRSTERRDERHARAASRRSRPAGSRSTAFVKPDLVAPGVGLLTADPGKAEDGSARYSSISGTSAASAIVAGAAALLAQARPELDASALKGLLAGSARQLPRESVAAQGTGLLDIGATAAGEVAALPTTLSFGRATRRSGWHATRRLVVRNLSSRRLSVRVRRRPTRPRRRPRARVRLRAVAGADQAARNRDGLRRRARAGADGRRRSRACSRSVLAGATRSTFPGWSRSRPRHDAAARRRSSCPAASSVPPTPRRPCSRSRRDASRPAGRSSRSRCSCSTSAASDGSKLGILAQLRDLLPGRYAFGLTGRDANGDTLEPGKYRLLLTAYPTGQGPPSRGDRAVHDSVTRAHRLILAAGRSRHLQPIQGVTS